jgi:hypothetical protein
MMKDIQFSLVIYRSHCHFIAIAGRCICPLDMLQSDVDLEARHISRTKHRSLSLCSVRGTESSTTVSEV